MIAAANAVGSEAAHARHLDAGYYRADIDGLRGIAVLAVIAFHAFPTHVPGGFVGVDVFFVISGFLISGIILRQLERSKFSYLQFYVRRVLRIFPALAIVLTASLLIGAFTLLPDEMSELGKHVLSAATFVSNFTLWQETGYFNRAAELKPLLHLWSLGVEEQFYLIWPIALLLLWKWRPQNLARYALLLSLVSFVFALVLAQFSSAANFYLPFSRFWELGVGCILAIVLHSRAPHTHATHMWHSLSHRARSSLAIAGVVLIALAIIIFDRYTTHPGMATLIPTLGAACVILAHAKTGLAFRFLGTAGLLRAGLISYPLYLWHWPLLSFAAILESGDPKLSTKVTAILLSIALAWLTYKFVELPIRTRRSTRAAGILVVALAVLGGLGLFVYANEGFPKRFDMDVRAMSPGPRTTPSCKDRFPKGMKFNYCKATSDAPPEIAFLGDSRAQAVYDGVVAATTQSTPLMLLARGGCPPLLNVELHYPSEQGCTEVWTRFADYVAKTKPRLVVLIGGGYDLFDPTFGELGLLDEHRSREAVFKDGLRQLLVSLQRTSRVIYVTQFPRFQTTPSCFLRTVRLPGTRCEPVLERKELEAGAASYTAILSELQAEFPQIQIVDSMAVLCGSSHCGQRAPSGEVIYTDELHLNPAGGRYFVQNSGLLNLLFEVEDKRTN